MLEKVTRLNPVIKLAECFSLTQFCIHINIYYVMTRALLLGVQKVLGAQTEMLRKKYTPTNVWGAQTEMI